MMRNNWIMGVGLVVLSACGSSTQTQSTSYISCQATPVSIASNVVTVSLTASGGTGPYTVSSIRNGTNIGSVAGTTSFSGSTQITGTFSTTSSTKIDTTLPGYVTIVDSSSPQISGVCAFSMSTSTGTTSTGTGTGGLSCTVQMSSNPSTAQNWVTATANINSSSSSAWLDTVSYPSNANIYGQYTSSTAARLYFGTSGTYQIDMLVRDSQGHWATCSTQQLVY